MNSAFKLLLPALGGDTTLDNNSRKSIEMFLANAKSRGYAATSINTYLKQASAAMQKAVDWGRISVSPLKGVRPLKVEKKPPQFLTTEECARFIACIDDVELRRMAVAYLATGYRR